METRGHGGRFPHTIGRVQRSWQARKDARARLAAGLITIASLAGTALTVGLARRIPSPAAGAVATERPDGALSGDPRRAGRPFLETAVELDRLALQYVAKEGRLRAPASFGTGFAAERRAVEDVARRILRTLCGPRSATLEPGADFWTAFERGWAAHFVALSSDNPESPARARAEETSDVAAYDYWSRRLERERLTRPGAASLFYPLWTWRYSWAASVRTVRGGISASRARGDSPPEPHEVLLDGDVVGSILYSLVTDPRIQATYRPSAFYDRFLAEGATPPAASPAETLSPLENAYLKIFHVLARSVRPKPAGSRPSPIITLIDEYARQFPDEAEAVYEAFLSSTGGLTVDAGLADFWPGNGATPGAWTEGRYLAMLARLRDRLVRGLITADAALQSPAASTSIADGDGIRARPADRGQSAIAAPWGGPFYPLDRVLLSLASRILLAMTAWGLAAAAAASASRALASGPQLELAAAFEPQPPRAAIIKIVGVFAKFAGLALLSAALLFLDLPPGAARRVSTGIVIGMALCGAASVSRSAERRAPPWLGDDAAWSTAPRAARSAVIITAASIALLLAV